MMMLLPLLLYKRHGIDKGKTIYLGAGEDDEPDEVCCHCIDDLKAWAWKWILLHVAFYVLDNLDFYMRLWQ